MEDWFSDGSKSDADLRLSGLARIVKANKDSSLLTIEQLAGHEHLCPTTVYINDRYKTRSQIKERLLQSTGEEDYSKLTDYFVLAYTNPQNRIVVGRPENMVFQEMSEHTATALLGALLGRRITSQLFIDARKVGTIAELVHTADEGMRITIIGQNGNKSIPAIDFAEIYIANGFVLDLSKRHPDIRYSSTKSSGILFLEGPNRRSEDLGLLERYGRILRETSHIEE